MTALYIISSIILILVLLLVSSIKLKISVSKDISVTASYLFFKYRILPKDKSKKPSQKDKKRPFDSLKKLVKENGFVGAVKEVLGIFKAIIKAIGKSAKHIRVKRFDLRIVAASDDPAKTGIEYGALCAVVFPTVKALQDTFKWNNNHTRVFIDSDFSGVEPKIMLESELKLKVWYIICVGFNVLIDVVKKRLSKVLNNQNKTKK